MSTEVGTDGATSSAGGDVGDGGAGADVATPGLDLVPVLGDVTGGPVLDSASVGVRDRASVDVRGSADEVEDAVVRLGLAWAAVG